MATITPVDVDSPAKLGALTLKTWRTPPHLREINKRLRRVAAGRLDRLQIWMPPRHGKSLLVSQFFPAWFLLVYPWKRVILCSYEADFAAQWGAKVRDLVTAWGKHFGVSVKADSKAADRWEIASHGGGMQTAGRGGPILGKGADLLVFDDLTKNAEEALSPTYREKAWDWCVSTAYTRLEPHASVVNIQQRWHTEDIAGKQVAAEPGRWDVLSLPALAEAGDPLGREVGEVLWPERYSAEALKAQQSLAPTWFAAQYQQKPIDLEGGFFRGLERIQVVGAMPTPDQFTRRVRFWDLASTEKQAGNDPDFTAGVLMGRHKDGTFWLLDAVHVRVGPKAVRQTIRQTAELDGTKVSVRIEREGGASGKIVANTIVSEDLAGWPALAVQPEGNKQERAEPWGAQIEAGNVRMVKAAWNVELLAEHRSFPLGTHDDLVDACSGCIRDLCRPQANVW